MTDEEKKEEVKEDAKKEDGGGEKKEEAPKEGAKEAASPKAASEVGGEGPPPGGAESDEWRIKNVKAKKNQFAINRLLLMFMDVKPDELTADTVEDLKKIYALLVHIHSIYMTLPP